MAERLHPTEDQLTDLALGHAAEGERDQVTAHLTTCPTCRRDYGEIADAVELVLPAVPRTAPPAGFEDGVLAALARGRQNSQKQAAGEHHPEFVPDPVCEPGRAVLAHRRSRRRWSVRLAVAAGISSSLSPSPAITPAPTATPSSPAASSRWEQPLVDTGGQAVGTVTPSRAADGPVLVVQIDDRVLTRTDGPQGYSYTCRLVLADGSTRDVGRWRLRADEPNSWVIAIPDEGVEAVEMVTEDGAVWSVAEF